MYDHVGLHVKNLTASVAFYEAALAPLGYGLCSRDETSAGFGPPNEPALWLYASKAAGAAHVAFKAKDRRGVVDMVAAAVMLQSWLDGHPRSQR